MADLSINESLVVAVRSGSIIETVGAAGGDITAGVPVRRDVVDSSQHFKAVNSSENNSRVRGIALNGASQGQPFDVLLAGDLVVGATLAAGSIYVLGNSDGAIMPLDDILSSEWLTILGVALSSTILRVRVRNTYLQIP